MIIVLVFIHYGNIRLRFYCIEKKLLVNKKRVLGRRKLIMATPPNVLFYSKDCVHCKKFSQMLFKLPDINAQFVKISVDVRNIRLPNYVKEVPTIVVFDDFKNKHVLNGSRAFEWLNQFLEEASQVEIVSYDIGVMGSSLSDGFSFLDEGEETEHTFAFLDQLQNTHITVPLNDPTIGSSKVNTNELERYQAERERGMPSIQRKSDVNFQQGFEQSGPHKISNSDVEKFKNLRSRQVARKPAPRRAPNFESSSFNPNSSAQSKRGGYVPYGGAMDSGARGGSQKEQQLQSRLERLQSDRDNLDRRFGVRAPQMPDQLKGISTNPRQQQGMGSMPPQYNPSLGMSSGMGGGRSIPRNSNFRTL
jgi:glutaredoxin-related protein